MLCSTRSFAGWCATIFLLSILRYGYAKQLLGIYTRQVAFFPCISWLDCFYLWNYRKNMISFAPRFLKNTMFREEMVSINISAICIRELYFRRRRAENHRADYRLWWHVVGRTRWSLPEGLLVMMTDSWRIVGKYVLQDKYVLQCLCFLNITYLCCTLFCTTCTLKYIQNAFRIIWSLKSFKTERMRQKSYLVTSVEAR